VHLSGIRISESIRLKVDDYQTAQTPMEEKKIDTKPRIVEAKPLLASEKSEVVTKLQQEVAKTVADPAIKAKADAAGLYPATGTPAEFAAFIKTEADRWSKVVAETGMKYD